MSPCTVIITTKDRWNELPTALTSVVKQVPSVNCIVVDDGSNSPVPLSIVSQFSEILFVRNETSHGLVEARNAAARLARSEFLVSLDDDAYFTGPDVIARSLEYLKEAHVGAVAIPHVDLINGFEIPRILPRVGGYVSQFCGCAYIIRRKLFLELGGFRGFFIRQGEEDDLCVRMLDRGYFVATGDEIGVVHCPSPVRSLEEIDFFGPRNRVLGAWLNFPLFLASIFITFELLRILLLGLSRGRIKSALLGWIDGVKNLVSYRTFRKPASMRTVALFFCMRGGRVNLTRLMGGPT